MPSSHHPSKHVTIRLIHTSMLADIVARTYSRRTAFITNWHAREEKQEEKAPWWDKGRFFHQSFHIHSISHRLFLLNRSHFFKIFQKVNITFPVFEFKSQSVMFWEISSLSIISNSNQGSRDTFWGTKMKHIRILLMASLPFFKAKLVFPCKDNEYIPYMQECPIHGPQATCSPAWP